ncbi:SusC/RagA family TonB-linked outer membrane protein [Marinoscillum furvescens]|uniref:TonB-linked SusC/RagA family outer membrane protein n=1 Tax=Marinoscillum furvescens DSM 4134 TaxID=1122208 RepID=A0A3D9L588_MARFU|nr:SusC/RagA family TonB-linked outer membrane protein [Marinoscillum furvescens]REE01162.1 TonB-linked SusC/RagA family outer membrane protein [Marinoscillum furvescens DSM 4134]
MVRIFFTCCLLVNAWQVLAQSVTIKGQVTDGEANDALPGVTVLIKGTSNGTVTDLEGNYSLTVEDPKSKTLVFSFIGYDAKEVPIGNATNVDVTLEMNLTELQEVVVTGLNGSQNKRALNYAVQDIKAKDVTATQQQNVVNSLQGKIAGVQVTSSSGSPGSSSSIVIRGGTSIGENRSNEPLFIIDGVIVDNSTFQGSGNRLMDINPEDIASISVLKGPTAAALYGIGAGNGAIIITTKTGEEGKIQVNVGSTVAFDQVFKTHGVQSTYGRGLNGVADDEYSLSWGPAFTSSDDVYDNMGEFFQTGVQQKYDLSINGGNKSSTFYLSASNNNQTGIVPGESYNRFNLMLKGTMKVHEKLEVTTSVNNIFSKNTRGGSGSMYQVFNWPRDNNMADYIKPNGEKNWLIPSLDPIYNNPENPYWRVNNNLPTYDINRTIGQVFFDWDVLESLKVNYRIGMDRSNQYYKRVTVPESSGSETNYNGRIYESEKDVKRMTSTLTAIYEKTFVRDWDVFLLAGHNVDMTSARSTSFSGVDFLLPNLHSINNVSAPYLIPVQNTTQRRIVGVFGEARLSYKGIASIGVTGRNDWASTLPRHSRSFFYPSLSAGFTFTELLTGSHTKVLSFGKLRASWAASGQDANPESLGVVLEQYPGHGGGYKHDYYAGNPFLKPERIESTEFGMNLSFFTGRLNLDVAKYTIQSKDMIIQNRISTASGWVIQTFNTGSMTNKGWEVVLDAKVLKKGDLTWNTSLNFSSNNSKLSDLPAYISRLPVTSGQILNEARPIALLDQPLYAIEGVPYLRNENGDVVIDEYGFPRWGTYSKDEEGNYIVDEEGYRKVSQEKVFLGDREPDWLMGITNTINYKNFNLSFLFDIRKGGDVINATSSAMMSRGTHQMLDEWRNKAYTFNGVVETPEGFVQNEEQVILDYNYFRFDYRSVGENFVEDGSWVKLRYIALGYDFNDMAERLGMQRLNFTVTGRNLFMLSKYSGGDPENDYNGSSIGGAGTVGLDYFNVPTTQGITFSLKATF